MSITRQDSWGTENAGKKKGGEGREMQNKSDTRNGTEVKAMW